MLRGVGVGPGQQEDVVGELGLGGPHLLAVDDPLVAVELGTGREAGQVGAGVGLAEALAPGDGALQDAGYELLLLLLGGPLEDGRSDQRVAEEVGPQRCLGPGELLVEDHRLHEAEPFAAVFLGPRGADPAPLEELGRPVGQERLALLLGHREPGRAPALRQVVGQPLADLSAERLGLNGVVQVHAGENTRRPRMRTGGGWHRDGPRWPPPRRWGASTLGGA